MATVTIASHVEAFDGARYKRSISSSGAASVPAKRLPRPTSTLSAQTPFPATTARPDQRVNVRVPVTRACYSRLLPGQVAFVNRHHGKWHPGPMPSGGLTPVASMEELNDMLSIERNHIVLGAGANIRNRLFKTVNARDMYRNVVVNGEIVKRRLSYLVFDGSSFPDTHPVHQFALDGLVATRVEEVDDLNTHSTAAAQQVCTVAVKGHAPMRLAHVPGEVGTGVLDEHQRSQDPASNVFLQPARILAKVYVVLVAVLVDDAKKQWKLQDQVVTSSNLEVNPLFATGHKLFRSQLNDKPGTAALVNDDAKKQWKLQYEVVSSSNLEVNPLFATGHKLFRSQLNDKPVTAVKGDRVVLRVTQLGSVVDTRFGPADQPQLTVCVHVAPYEPTEVVMRNQPDESDITKTVNLPLRKPKQAFRAFSIPDNPKSAKAAAVTLPASSGLRRMPSGARPTIGAGAAEFASLKNAISAMQVVIQDLAAQIKETEKQQREDIEKLKTEIYDLDAARGIEQDKQTADTIKEVRAVVDEVREFSTKSAERDAALSADTTKHEERASGELQLISRKLEKISKGAAARAAAQAAAVEASESARSTGEQRLLKVIRELKTHMEKVALKYDKGNKARSDELEKLKTEIYELDAARGIEQDKQTADTIKEVRAVVDEVREFSAKSAERDAALSADTTKHEERASGELQLISRKLEKISKDAAARAAAQAAAVEASESARSTGEQRLLKVIQELKTHMEKVALKYDEGNRARSDELQKEFVKKANFLVRGQGKLETDALQLYEAVNDKIDGFIDEQRGRTMQAAEVFVKTRVVEWIDALLEGRESLENETPEDAKLKQFAAELINEYELADEIDEYTEFDDASRMTRQEIVQGADL